MASSASASPSLVLPVKLIAQPFSNPAFCSTHRSTPPALDHGFLHSQTKKTPGVTRTSPLGPTSPLWAPRRADSPAGRLSGKPEAEFPAEKVGGPLTPSHHQACLGGTRLRGRQRRGVASAQQSRPRGWDASPEGADPGFCSQPP